jgi:hypothetical protein
MVLSGMLVPVSPFRTLDVRRRPPVDDAPQRSPTTVDILPPLPDPITLFIWEWPSRRERDEPIARGDKGKPVDAKQIGHELGVLYVLEGSVRRSGDRVRVNAQLVNAQTGGHLWAERFDRHSGDLFGLQDEITGRIALTVQSELISAEAHRSTSDPDAQDYILRGRAAQSKPFFRGKHAEVASFFERALALDPLSTEARSRLANALVGGVIEFQSDTPAADMQRAKELIDQVLAASPNSAFAHFAKAQFLRAQSRSEDAIFEYETAIALDRNFANAYGYLGACKLLTGVVDEVIPLEEQAIRLDPRSPDTGSRYFYVGAVHLLRSCLDEATLWFEKARSTYSWFHPRVPCGSLCPQR